MKKIILIGPPGSGKSTVGKALAARLQIPFLDTDLIIANTARKKISDIFIDDGEEVFRAIEFATLKTALLSDGCVISLGGGAPISDQAQQEILKSDSNIIFLDVSLATAAPRVGFNRSRPLLLGNPRAQWQSLSDQRRPIYEKLATFSIKVDHMSIVQIVDLLAKQTQ